VNFLFSISVPVHLTNHPSIRKSLAIIKVKLEVFDEIIKTPGQAYGAASGKHRFRRGSGLLRGYNYGPWFLRGEVVVGDFQVGPWLIEPSLNAVSHNGESIHLSPKVMSVLVCLAQHPGQSVSKEDLLQTVWPDTFVSDDVLKGSISELRRVLEDDAHEPTIIQTIPKRGYRLVATVQPVNGAPESSTENRPETQRAVVNTRKFWMGALAVVGATLLFVFLGANFGGLRARLASKMGAPQIHSLAVLPLQNLSNDPAQEYFSDGMTDALITDLAQISSLKVISRTSSMQYRQTKMSLPEIARELNVDGIIEGTVQRSGDRVRITAQLIYGPSDKHLWAHSYERDMREVFALERDVTQEIVREVRARLTTPNQSPLAPPRPASPEVLEAYLQGNYHLSRFGEGAGDEELKKAQEYFQRAIDADPNFAPAFNGLAIAHTCLLQPSNEDFNIAKKMAERAVELDPNSSDAHHTLGYLKLNAWDWYGSEEEYRRAIALNPNNAHAHDDLGELLDDTGRLDEGWREYQIAQELDPNNDHLSDALDRQGQHERAIAMLQMMLKRYPDNGYLHLSLYRDYVKKGMHKEAIQELEKTANLFGFPKPASRIHHAFVSSGYRGAMRQFAWELEDLAATKQAFVPVNLAEVYATLGDKDRAFYWLEQAYADRDLHAASTDLGLERLNTEFLLDPLRSDPRFQDLVRRVGLQQ
jgi:TolB-like protein/DNA-binding winged helix-turn-helix (wHTH) protein/Tfp pilus assembly protein PilF